MKKLLYTVHILWLQAAVDNGGLIDFDGGENWLKRWTMFCVTIFVEYCDFRVIYSPMIHSTFKQKLASTND
jgi:hypothetical protein